MSDRISENLKPESNKAKISWALKKAVAKIKPDSKEAALVEAVEGQDKKSQRSVANALGRLEDQQSQESKPQ